LILSHLHPVCRDTTKRKYNHLVPQNDNIPLIPLECHVEMLSATIAQWCIEERLEYSSLNIDIPASHVLEVQDSDLHSFTDMHIDEASPPLSFSSKTIDATTVEMTIKHIVCYVAGGAQKGTYPKCSTCGLPGHKIEQCHPLIIFSLTQALAAQHMDIVKCIKATYKLFPRTNHTRAPRIFSVKQLVSLFNLPSYDPSSDEDPDILPATAIIKSLTPVVLSAVHTAYADDGHALVSFRDHPWFPSSTESPARTFDLVDTPSL
jgi:hypothetical protein